MKIKLLQLFIVLIVFCLSLIYTPNEKEVISTRSSSEQGKSSDAWDAFQWWYTQRAYPYELIPQGAFQKASNYLKVSFKKENELNKASNDTLKWISIGPKNIAGRILSIAIDPRNTNIVWAGSASGGLWKSTTGGIGTNAWTYINTGFPTLSVSCITLDSLNPDIMYIGTGEISLYHRPLIGTPGARASYGMGILKSTNSGNTWFQTGLTWTFSEITAIQKIVINPLSTKTIYAATSEGIFKSIDAGITWTLSNNVLMAMDVVMCPNDTTLLISAHGNYNSSPNPGIYRTMNSGNTWTQITSGLPSTNLGRTALAFSQSNSNIILAGISNAVYPNSAIGIYKSTDFGTTWSVVSTQNYIREQGWYNNVLSLHPKNPDTIFCGGVDLYKSTNGGTSLGIVGSGLVHVDNHAIAFDPVNPRIVYFGTDGGIFKTTNSGQTFIDCNNGLVTTQFYPGFANAYTDSNISIGGLQDNGTLKYSGSTNWSKIFGADGGWCAIDPTNKNIMYYEMQNLDLFKSTNGGGTASRITSGLPPGNFISPFVICNSSPNILYAGSNDVYKTTNSGSTWFSTGGFNNTNIACIGISFSSPDTLIAATGTGALGATPKFEIFASTNGGDTWTNVTYNLNGSDSLPDRYPTDIEFDPTNSSVAYLTYSGYGSSHIFRTINVGLVWTDISSNLPDIPHQAVLVDPLEPNNLYVGTDLGVFYSSNNGTNWGDFSNGMPAAMTLDLTVSYANDMLRASTHGNGVYQRKFRRSPTLSLTRPNGDEVWTANHTENILWSQTNLKSVKIEFSSDNGNSWNNVVIDYPASSNYYPWLVPSISTTQGRIRITDASNGTLVDSNDESFTIIVNPDVVRGWNLISIDVNVLNPLKDSLYPTATSKAFEYVRGYRMCDTLKNGIGYWLKFDIPQFTNFTGDTIAIDTVYLSKGWNIIGSISRTIDTNQIASIPDGIIVTKFWGYNNSYFAADSIKPKHGYWIKTKSDGYIIFCSLIKKEKHFSQIEANPNFNSLIISDSKGNRQTLYFTSHRNNINDEHYELPPLPPKEAFDARYKSNRVLEIIPEDIRTSIELPILIQLNNFPITLSWNILDNEFNYSIICDNKELIYLSSKGNTSVRHQTSIITLRVSPAKQEFLSNSFSLEQNYPNPFNPNTIIRYQLPVNSKVTLEVYNILGQKIATLVDETQDAGYKSIKWNASGLPSGIYIYKLITEEFTTTRKMILVQ